MRFFRASGTTEQEQNNNNMDKYLIVGLGNPGAEYHETRHNSGWMVADKLAADLGATFSDKRYGYIAEASLKGRKLFILKPTTFMNLSGGERFEWWNQRTGAHTAAHWPEIRTPAHWHRQRVRPGQAGGLCPREVHGRGADTTQPSHGQGRRVYQIVHPCRH